MLVYNVVVSCSLFFIFLTHLTLTMALFITMCIANMVIHYGEVEDNPDNSDLSGAEVFGEVMKEYWISIVGSFIASVFSIFVFGLCGFHTYLVSIGLTT